MKILKPILFILAFLFIGISWADSPLTSTPFWKAYKTNKYVSYAAENGYDKKVGKYLLSKKVPSEIKLAIINQYSFNSGWDVSYEEDLMAKRKGLDTSCFTYLMAPSESTPKETKQTQLLTADDLMCWAYFKAMSDYNAPQLYLKAAFLAFQRDGENGAYGTAFALIAAQKAFDYDWCKVYTVGKDYIQDYNYQHNTLSKEAIKIIMDYLNLYKQDCK